MRSFKLALLLLFALSATLHAGESLRLNFVKGVYSASVPANWCVDIDADDSTLTLAQGPDPISPRVILAVPNPFAADRLDEYCRLAANSIMGAMGGGQILQEGSENGEYGVIFKGAAAGINMVGASHCRRYGDYAVLSIFITREDDYAVARDNAAVILDSLRVNDAPLAQNAAYWREKATNLLKDFGKFQGR